MHLFFSFVPFIYENKDSQSYIDIAYSRIYQKNLYILIHKYEAESQNKNNYVNRFNHIK